MGSQIVFKPKKDEIILTRFTEKETVPENDKIFEVEKGTTNKQFSLGISGHITLSPNAMEKLGYAATLFFVLVQLRVKKEFQERNMKTYERYWKNGILATAADRGHLCKRLNLKDKDSITRRTQWLEENGIIKIDRLHPSECFDGQQHNVYKLGTYDIGKGEYYYIYDLC